MALTSIRVQYELALPGGVTTLSPGFAKSSECSSTSWAQAILMIVHNTRYLCEFPPRMSKPPRDFWEEAREELRSKMSTYEDYEDLIG